MQPTLYEFAGGEPALAALAAAHHARCLADPELNHPFARSDLNPHHVERLAAYWGEVLGGPAAYSALGESQSGVVRMHAGNGDMTDMGRRFVNCFVTAMDDAELPTDREFRATMRAYMEWAVEDVLVDDSPDSVPGDLPVPRWSWDGLQPAAPAH